jgi:beta-glucosidase-like glycosyl hydrolase
LSEYGQANLSHPALALEAAKQSIVLLKNNHTTSSSSGSGSSSGGGGGGGGLGLPFAKGGSIGKLAVIGTHAGDNRLLKGR